jgi:TrmH family RNA methyltransferase
LSKEASVQEEHHPINPVGPSHPRVTQYLRLKSNRGGGPISHTIVEGAGLIRAALAHGARVEVLAMCPELLGEDAEDLVAQVATHGGDVVRVSPRTFGRLTSRDGPDGLAALARFRLTELDRILPPTPSRVLVLDRFESPGNVGSLIRSASAAGAAAVVLAGRRVRPNHPLIIKSSVGAAFSVPICSVPEDRAALWLRRRGFQILAADPGSTASYRDATFPERVAIVLGSERFGLSEFWRRSVDAQLAIPMLGSVDSLNAGHAGALFLFEARFQQERRVGSAE